MKFNTREAFSLDFGLDLKGLNSLHWAAIALAAVTGIVHLYLYFTQETVVFLLAGLGFFGAIALLLFNVFRPVLYLVGIPYTVVQMVGWYTAGMPDFTLGVADKLIQAALIILLAYLAYGAWVISEEAAEVGP